MTTNDLITNRMTEKLTFASSDELRKYWNTAREFMGEIVGYDIDGIFVSDESSLWDFLEGEDLSKYHAHTLEKYGVDISDIESGNLVEIAKKIEAARYS
jgi:hypothetical protein